MADWFIQHDEETEIGPLTPSELLGLVRTGVVSADTLCRKEDSPWYRAGDVGGLMKAAQSEVVGYRCPYCQKSVSEPPTYCRGCSKYIDTATEILRDANGKKLSGDAKKFDTPKETLSSWSNWVVRLKEQRAKKSTSGTPEPRNEADE